MRAFEIEETNEGRPVSVVCAECGYKRYIHITLEPQALKCCPGVYAIPQVAADGRGFAPPLVLDREETRFLFTSKLSINEGLFRIKARRDKIESLRAKRRA